MIEIDLEDLLAIIEGLEADASECWDVAEASGDDERGAELWQELAVALEEARGVYASILAHYSTRQTGEG